MIRIGKISKFFICLQLYQSCDCSLYLSGAVVLRLAKSWFRIGSLEILTRTGELDVLR